MLTFVKKELSGDSRKVFIAVRSESAAELTSVSTRNQVIKEAALLGLVRPGLGATPQPYPVDSNGNCSDDLLYGRVPVAAYQLEYEVNGAI